MEAEEEVTMHTIRNLTRSQQAVVQEAAALAPGVFVEVGLTYAEVRDLDLAAVFVGIAKSDEQAARRVRGERATAPAYDSVLRKIQALKEATP